MQDKRLPHAYHVLTAKEVKSNLFGATSVAATNHKYLVYGLKTDKVDEITAKIEKGAYTAKNTCWLTTPYDLDEHTPHFDRLTFRVLPCSIRPATEDEIAEFNGVLNDCNLEIRDIIISRKSAFGKEWETYETRLCYKDKNAVRFIYKDGVYTLDNIEDAAKKLPENTAFVWFSDNGYSHMSTDPSDVSRIKEYVEKHFQEGTDRFAHPIVIGALNHFRVCGYFDMQGDASLKLNTGGVKPWSETSNT